MGCSPVLSLKRPKLPAANLASLNLQARRLGQDDSVPHTWELGFSVSLFVCRREGWGGDG